MEKKSETMFGKQDNCRVFLSPVHVRKEGVVRPCFLKTS